MSSPIIIKVGAKVVGQKRTLFNDYPISLISSEDGHSRMKLRELIAAVVTHEVQAFRERQEERKLALVLSPEQIEQGVVQGKIDLGERDLQQTVIASDAIKTALQAFEDGLYYVFLNDTQLEVLDEDVIVSHDNRMLFVRLVALAGG
jgi:hypothetical protein